MLLIQQAEEYVTHFLEQDFFKQCPFHNIDHTRYVVKTCHELAEFYQLDTISREELLIAAWFHDTGYRYRTVGHELESCKVALTFLSGQPNLPHSIPAIVDMILVTRYPSYPVTLQQKILCDADLRHLSLHNYTTWSTRLQEEIKIHIKPSLTVKEWNGKNIEFMLAHRYFTHKALQDWEEGKQRNLQTLKEQEAD